MSSTLIQRARGRPLKGNKKRERITLTLESDYLLKLEQEAKSLDISRSDYIQKYCPLSDSEEAINTWPTKFPNNSFTRLVLPHFLKDVRGLCIKHKISRLELFGSILTPHFSEKSDIDILISFNKGNIPGLFTISKIERELSSLFFNKKIDLRTREDLAPEIYEKVKDNTEILFIDERKSTPSTQLPAE